MQKTLCVHYPVVSAPAIAAPNRPTYVRCARLFTTRRQQGVLFSMRTVSLRGLTLCGARAVRK
jgi:hypothetical protein